MSILLVGCNAGAPAPIIEQSPSPAESPLYPPPWPVGVLGFAGAFDPESVIAGDNSSFSQLPVSLNDSANISGLIVTVTANSPGLTIVTPQCVLATDDPVCFITILGNESGAFSVTASAPGYSSVISGNLVVNPPVWGPNDAK
jgi:hypothetical protein